MAQVNIFTGETMRQMRLESGLYNRVALDLTYRTGNTDLLTARTRFRSDYLTKAYHGFIFGSLQQGRKNGEFFINKGIAHARIIRSLTPHILFESFGQKQFNESILLSDRNLVGGGVRFASHPRNSRFNLYLGIGAMWEHERINDKENDWQVFPTSHVFDQLANAMKQRRDLLCSNRHEYIYIYIYIYIIKTYNIIYIYIYILIYVCVFV